MDNNSAIQTEVLRIGREDYVVQLTELNQKDLLFYDKNPRVYSVLNTNGRVPSQEEIEEFMVNQDHVKQLKNSIESNGGLMDAIIVLKNVVLEGNSRLAAYRILAETNPIKWGKIKCRVLPENFKESAIFALLGQYHIVGKKDWEPFEQANYLYRRHQETRIPVESMATELGITTSRANRMIEIITFMISNSDCNKRHYSYYEEYFKASKVKPFRETNPDLDATITEAIKNDEISSASDLRKLNDIAKVNDRQAKKLIQRVANGEIDLYQAHQIMVDQGKLGNVVVKLKDFRFYLTDNDVKKQISVNEEVYNQAQFEIDKIIKILSKLKK